MDGFAEANVARRKSERFPFRSLSDVSYSDECRTKKSFQYAKAMFPLFRAIVKFCSTNRLFTKSEWKRYNEEDPGECKRMDE